MVPPKKKAEYTTTKASEPAPKDNETVKQDTSDVVPTDPNELAPKAGYDNKGTSEVKEEDIQYVQIVSGPTEADAEAPETETVDKDFVYVQHLDPARRIPGTNPYLDNVQRVEAEKIRAIAEDREPDLENPPSFQGSPLRSLDAVRSELPPVFDKFDDFSDSDSVVSLPVVVSK